MAKLQTGVVAATESAPLANTTPESPKAPGLASLADFRQYYSDNIRTVGCETMDKLYLKFPQPKTDPVAQASEAQPKFAHHARFQMWDRLLRSSLLCNFVGFCQFSIVRRSGTVRALQIEHIAGSKAKS